MLSYKSPCLWYLNVYKTLSLTDCKFSALVYNMENRSSIDQINTLRIVIEQCIEWSSHLYTVFINFEKASDSINREAMWKEVKRCGVPTQIVNLSKETYQGYACRIVHEGRVSEPISVQTGVWQGCVLSPTMFLTVLDAVMRNVNRDSR